MTETNWFSTTDLDVSLKKWNAFTSDVQIFHKKMDDFKKIIFDVKHNEEAKKYVQNVVRTFDLEDDDLEEALDMMLRQGLGSSYDFFKESKTLMDVSLDDLRPSNRKTLVDSLSTYIVWLVSKMDRRHVQYLHFLLDYWNLHKTESSCKFPLRSHVLCWVCGYDKTGTMKRNGSSLNGMCQQNPLKVQDMDYHRRITRLSLKTYHNNRNDTQDMEVYCAGHVPTPGPHDPIPHRSNLLYSPKTK